MHEDDWADEITREIKHVLNNYSQLLDEIDDEEHRNQENHHQEHLNHVEEDKRLPANPISTSSDAKPPGPVRDPHAYYGESTDDPGGLREGRIYK